METHGASLNFGAFVGAATVRQYVKGMAPGEATPAELDQMKTLLRNAMLDGAFGLGSALIYPPGNYATTHELAEVSKAMAPFGGIYITHMRSEADHLLESIDEALAIGREAGVPVEIYHLKAAGRRNWNKIAEAIARLERARQAGQDAGADMYPYTAGATGLTACFPPWTAAMANSSTTWRPARGKGWGETKPRRTEPEDGKPRSGGRTALVALNQPETNPTGAKRQSRSPGWGALDWLDAAMDLVLTSAGGRLSTS
jgi:dihydroorotase/N-acyl-D-amino-acid deacylase